MSAPTRYDGQLASNIYRSRALRELGRSVLVVEGLQAAEFWHEARKRIRSAREVTIRKNGEQAYTADGPPGRYEVDTARVKCTCPDFHHRGRRSGFRCKHLVAALQREGTWDTHWGDHIPDWRRVREGTPDTSASGPDVGAR